MNKEDREVQARIAAYYHTPEGKRELVKQQRDVLLVPATEGKIVKQTKNWMLYEGDKAVDYEVVVRVHTKCRRDNPAWQMAIHETIMQGKYDTVKIIPLIKK